VPVSEAFKEYGVKTFTLEELKNKDKLPSSVDKSQLEVTELCYVYSFVEIFVG
jgi:hypothetical protein